MEKILFGIFMVVLSLIAGVSAFGIVLSAQFYRKNREAAKKRFVVERSLVKGGFLITSGVLLIRLLEAGTADVSWAAWAFLIGLIIAGAGIVMFTQDTIEVLADREVK